MYEQRLPIEEWKAKKQAELKETIAAQKSVLQEVVQDGQRLADYLYGRGRLAAISHPAMQHLCCKPCRKRGPY